MMSLSDKIRITSESEMGAASGLRRALGLLRVLAAGPDEGMRLKDIAAAAACSPSTAHRALQEMTAEGFVEQVQGEKRYRLALDFFVLAAKAGRFGSLRALARPVLLNLSATLADSVFLLVRHGFDAVCLDRIEGPFPIRSFTGDIGGKVPLGLGQGSLAILAHLPDDEREAVIRFNVPRLLDRGDFDEAGLRQAIARAREAGWVDRSTGLLSGMAGVGVAVCDPDGRAVAALSIGTLGPRLQAKRLPYVVKILQDAAAQLGARINPFDPSLRDPMRSFRA